MKRYLFRRFAKGTWGLLADIDELFSYPSADRVSMGELLGYLRGNGYTAVLAHMLDMFSLTPPKDASSAVNIDLKAQYRYYNASDIRQVPYHQVFDRLNTIPEAGSLTLIEL